MIEPAVLHRGVWRIAKHEVSRGKSRRDPKCVAAHRTAANSRVPQRYRTDMHLGFDEGITVPRQLDIWK
jgi:hypothetical protein